MIAQSGRDVQAYKNFLPLHTLLINPSDVELIVKGGYFLLLFHIVLSLLYNLKYVS
ncbi:hypothetical protein [Brevibacillus laterosporus]|uniref:hypothetical protein n=1 Tax=Brevibacillus laterosporus TaxID=1465 RepID=UPI00024054FC|nr:hypothetical protein [Brevibacillus laterosporus]CCF17066.1 hypothetical protein BLGI_5047 [Brevibacillus laterosporus GI-9]